MPKETIKDTSMKNWEIKVGWDKTGADFYGGVEIATIARDMPLITEDTLKETNGWHIHLNEERLDQLIRTLQKAGRQTFGRRPW